MPLNYSKWDQLELSDDSDIEGHPNVDKKSLVRWKQRDIWEKRDERNYKIASLKAQIECNKVLLPRVKEVADRLASTTESTPATVYFNSLVDKLRNNPSKDCPKGNDPSKVEQTYDGMLLSLLAAVSEKAKERVKDANVLDSEKEERLAKELAKEMAMHVANLGESIKNDTKQAEKEESEKSKKITSESIHEGFSNKYVPPLPEPAPVPTTGGKGKEKEKVTTFEVLNPKSQTTTADPDDEDEEGIPEMTPSLIGFSKISTGEYEKSFQFIQGHRDVYVPGASDALFIAAFKAEGEGKKKYAKQCIHQSLLIQYCEKLGKDGVGIFFKKMINGDQRATMIFKDDVEKTYKHLVERVKINKEEAASEAREQIQLVAENPDTVISFNVPDGPPPENLVLEGPGTEGMDIEEVRKALEFKWKVFQDFPEDLQIALKGGKLEDVNVVLGKMEVPEAEAVVESLDMAGILSFADNKFRDETGQPVN